MEAAGLRPFEFVHVNNVNNAVHWETYVIPGDDGEIILNGPVARLFQKGDPIVIMALAELEDHEIPGFIHTDVFVNKKNEVIEIVQNREKSIFKMDPID
jgi:aspartate 1-decarboxylase